MTTRPTAKVVELVAKRVSEPSITKDAPVKLLKVSFHVADAFDQPFPDDQFDLVWSMESGEHMPEHSVYKIKDLCNKILSMEANCEKVLAVAEKVRRPTSKRDVPEEHHVETEIKIDDVLLAKVDDTFMDHTELDSPRPSLSMDIDESEIDKSTNQYWTVSDNIIIQSDVIYEMPQNPKQFALEGECKDEFEKHDSDHVSKKLLQKHIMPEHVENHDKQLKGTYETSPGPNERRERTRKQIGQVTPNK